METQERIKDRVLKRAAQVWGYADSELETSFDPVVALLLEACAYELEKLSSELDNSHTRVVERLLEIMSPISNSGPIPARAIIHATPIENNHKTSLEHQFFCKKSTPNIYDPINPIVKDIYFGPSIQCTLTTNELEYVAFGNTIFSVSQFGRKDVFTKSDKNLKPATMWWGIQCKEVAGVLQRLMLYSEVRSNRHGEAFYHYLQQSKLFLGDREIKFSGGYNTESPDLDIESIVTKNYNRINQIYSEVNKFYKDKFIHLEEDIQITPDTISLPEEFSQVFHSEKLNELKNIIWLRVEFPEIVINEILENVSFSTNCFPVINKHLLKASEAIDEFINYIPLITNDHFLDLENITDVIGQNYHLKDFSEGNLSTGDATLRNNGVVRFDERNASELIQYLLEMLKDESASFSVLGGDFIKNILEQLNQLIATLEQQAKEKSFLKSNFPYVIIKPQPDSKQSGNDALSVTFWSTCGEDANNVKQGTRLTQFSGTDFITTSPYMVTASVGGKTRLSTQEKILSYREALLTHDRIVTFADIKAFCFNHLKHAVVSVEIKKGTKKDASLKTGFVRTIDIYITPNPDMNPPLTKSEWDYLEDNLLQKLNELSNSIYPYRFIILEENKLD